MDTTTRSRKGLEFLRALNNRDFALLWSGQTVSLIGNGIFAVALPLEVLRLTGSALDLGLVASARTLAAALFMLIGGVASDRFSPRLVILASDGVCGLCVGLVAVLIASGHSQLWALTALSAVFGFGYAFLLPALTAIAPDILPSDQLGSASSLNLLSQSLSQYLVGPLLGGLIVVIVGPSWAFGLDAVSFVISAICLVLMRPGRRTARESSAILSEIAEGLRYCRSQAWLWWSILGLCLANLACFTPVAILEALLVRQVFHANGFGLGLMYASSGTGGLLASVVAGQYTPRRRVTLIWTSWAGAGAATVLLGLSPWLWTAFVLAGAVWFGVTYGNVLWFPLMQQEVPREMLGRASSVDWMFSIALTPLGTLIGGALAQAIGPRETLVAGGLTTVAAGAVLLIPGVTAPDRRLPEPAQPAQPA